MAHWQFPKYVSVGEKRAKAAKKPVPKAIRRRKIRETRKSSGKYFLIPVVVLWNLFETILFWKIAKSIIEITIDPEIPLFIPSESVERIIIIKRVVSEKRKKILLLIYDFGTLFRSRKKINE